MAHYDNFARKRLSLLSGMVLGCFYRKLCGYVQKLGFRRGMHLLEIGGGNGEFAELCRGLGLSYRFHEQNQLLCARLRDRGFDGVCASVPPISEPDGHFDVVALLNVVEHMSGSDVAESLIGEVHRVLKADGAVFLICPSYLDWGKDFRNLDYTHSLPTTEISVSQLLADCGFRVERVGYHYGCFFSGLGRAANACARLCRFAITLLLPRSLSRSVRVQKMGATFAENFMVFARKV